MRRLVGSHNFLAAPSRSLVLRASVEPVSVVRDLDVYIDSDLGAATHVRRTMSRCFAALWHRHLRRRRHVTNDCFRSRGLARPLQAWVWQLRVFGLPAYLQRRLGSSFGIPTIRLRRYDHVSDALAILRWLRLPERVNFKLALMAYRLLNGLAPPYLNQLVPVSSLPGRRCLLSSFTLQLHVQQYRLSSCQQPAVDRLLS